MERKVAAEDQLKRIDIRAPQDGIVHQLAVHTIGGVIAAERTDPDADRAGGRRRSRSRPSIPPQDIDQLTSARRRCCASPAFNQRTTPELNGIVTRISADITQDQKTGAAFYVVRISMPAAELARLNGVKLVPGMPVEAFVQTGDRTVMSFLVKPLHDQIMKAFRER